MIVLSKRYESCLLSARQTSRPLFQVAGAGVHFGHPVSAAYSYYQKRWMLEPFHCCPRPGLYVIAEPVLSM